MDNPSPVPQRAKRRWYYWLFVLPFIWQIALVPFVNNVAFAPLGLPFPMVWQMAGIVFTSAILAFVYSFDRRDSGSAPESGQDR